MTHFRAGGSAVPTNRSGVGIVGVGGVARYAHLPAYRRQGIRVTAVCDRDQELAQEVAAEFDLAVAADVGELAAREDVEVVDIATPPATHSALIRAAAPAGKPMLVQKPLCTTAAELAEIVAVREEYGSWIRLNLTGRYVSAWRKIAELLEAGLVGRPFLCTINNRDWWDRAPGRWDHDVESYIVFEMLIHHLELCRFWFGGPRRLVARAGSNPAQRMQQSNWICAMVEFGTPDLVQILEDWTMPEFSFATGHPYEQVTITGDRGVIRATSERVELSVLGEDTVHIWHLARPGQTLPGQQLTVNWFPDSFGISMADFLAAVATGEGQREDWDHLLELTHDTFAAAEAISAPAWVTMPQAPDIAARAPEVSVMGA